MIYQAHRDLRGTLPATGYFSRKISSSRKAMGLMVSYEIFSYDIEFTASYDISSSWQAMSVLQGPRRAMRSMTLALVPNLTEIIELLRC